MMWDRRNKPRYPLWAVPKMLETTAAFVLCDFWGERRRDGQQSKKPIHNNYQKQRPGFTALKHHIDRDGLLGLMPESLGLAALDVDRGDASTLIVEYPPWFVARSNRPGGIHLFYRNPHGLRFPRKWAGPQGTGGELVQGSQYVVLWHNTLAELAEALEDPLNQGGVDFGQMASALRWSTPERKTAGARDARSLPAGPPTLTATVPGSRNDDNFDALRFWAYEHWRDYSTKEDFHQELQARALAGRDSMPDVGPGPEDGEEYTEQEALASAHQVAEGVWGWFVTKERQYSKTPDFQGKSGKSGALRADSRPVSRGGQSWESWEVENPEWSWHSGRCHHVSGEECRGDPALNGDSEVQSRRRSVRTEQDAQRVKHRRQAVGRLFVLGNDVRKLAAVFGTSMRTIERDLASLEKLPSRRQARREAQSESARRQRKGPGNPPRPEGGTGLNVSGHRDTAGEEGQVQDRAGPSFTPLHPPENKDGASAYYSTGGGLPPTPRDNGLMSPPWFPGPDPPREGLSDGQ